MAVRRDHDGFRFGAVWRPAPGTFTLLLLRAGWLLVSALPALVAGLVGVARSSAEKPYFTDVSGLLPWGRLIRLMQDVGPALGGVAGAAVLLGLLGDQVLLGTALKVMAPLAPTTTPKPPHKPRVWATLWNEGLLHVWVFLRAALLGIVASGGGVALLRLLGKRLDIVGYRAGWSALAGLKVTVSLMVLGLLWLATVGAWVFWCRVLTLVDGRRRVRRTAMLVLRVFWRRPLGSWGLFVVLGLLGWLLSGVVLLAWRQSEPGQVGAALGWFTLWLTTLLLQAWLWVVVVRAARLLYASPPLDDLHDRPDTPWRWLGWLWARVTFWRRRPGPLILTPTPMSAQTPPAAVDAPASADAGLVPAQALPPRDD